MNRTTLTRSFSALAAAVAISAAFAVPATAGATAHSGGGGQGKVSVHDISMSTGVERSAHTGGTNFLLMDGSVRFDAYGGFLGGVVVATGDVPFGGARLTKIAIDPSDAQAAAPENLYGGVTSVDEGVLGGAALGSVTDMIVDPFNR